MTGDAKLLARLLMESFYSGELSIGPVFPVQGLLSAPLAKEESDKILQEERLKRIPALFEHFGIDSSAPDAWKLLALALASRHVPGFQWNYLAALEALSNHGNLGFGSHRIGEQPGPVKRTRGRPRKIKYTAGLLSLGAAPARKGRPVRYTLEQKRELIALFDEVKQQHNVKTDLEAATIIMRKLSPSARDSRLTAEARPLVQAIRTWRHETKKLEKSE